MKSRCVTLFASLLLLVIGGDALPITLTVSPDILSGRNFCPNTSVSFSCTAYDVRVLRWLRNGNEIVSFTSLDMQSTEPRLSGAFQVYLNSSDKDSQNNLNVTSTLIGVASDFQNGDQIACLDTTGETRTLNFMLITSIPTPDGFNAFFTKSDTVYFNIQWDLAFSDMHRIETYMLEASNEFIECPQMCSSDESLCRCSGLTAGNDVNITITATSCGNLQGPPTVINITPRVPTEVPVCSSYPVYDASNTLTMLRTTWNKTTNPLAPRVLEDIAEYTVSVNGEDIPVLCSNTSSTCSYSYALQSSSSSFTVSVAAVNVFGRGPVRNCNPPSDANGMISQTNDVFSVVLSTTNSNRSVECTRQSEVLSCQFCIDNSTTCYDLEDSNGLSAANAALTNLPNGTYFYRVIAFLDGVPVASVYDFFSTYCPPSELVTSDGQANSKCLTISNGIVCYDGTVAGSMATYECNNGYALMGTAQRMCRNDGRWEESIPSCVSNVPPWVIPLLAISVILYVISMVDFIISIPISIYLQRKVSQSKIRSLIEYCMLAVEIVLFIVIFILWMVYASDPNGPHGWNSVIAAFVFSLVLIVVGFSDTIIAFVTLVPTVYNVSGDESPNEAKSETSKYDTHKSVQQ